MPKLLLLNATFDSTGSSFSLGLKPLPFDQEFDMLAFPISAAVTVVDGNNFERAT